LPGYETHISTKPHQAQTYARISGQDVHSWWTSHPETTSRQGPRPAFPLIGIARDFGRNSRLLVAADYDLVFRRSRRSADQYFTVLFRPNRLGYARVGLAIAKKRVRRAVDRNRVKRLIRESFRNARPGLDGLDIVVLARNNTARADNTTVFASLEHHWQTMRNQAIKTNKGPALN